MKINEEKCETIITSKGKTKLPWEIKIGINNKVIKQHKNIKILGVEIDQNLKFQKHVDKIINKMDKTNNLLKCLRGINWGASKNQLRMIYLALGRSHIDYAASIWSRRISKGQQERIEICQRRALRSVSNLCRTTPIDAIYRECNIWEAVK